MAVGLGSTLTSLLLNPYAQTTLQAAQQQRGLTPTDPIKPGTTLTARYMVEPDGELSLRDVNVVDAAEDATSEQSGQQSGRQLAARDERPASFADFARPRAIMSPSDEIQLFAAPKPAQATLALPSADGTRQYTVGNVTVIEPENSIVATGPLDIAAQQQQRVAGLYARNADITFNVDPAYSEAA